MIQEQKCRNVFTDPRCEQERYDCNRIFKGNCMLLTDAHFNKPCPFYKKNEPGKEGK